MMKTYRSNLTTCFVRGKKNLMMQFSTQTPIQRPGSFSKYTAQISAEHQLLLIRIGPLGQPINSDSLPIRV